MERSAKKFFTSILETPSPSGYEQPVQEIVRRYVADFADDVRTDLHGNVIACKNPSGKLRVTIISPEEWDRPTMATYTDLARVRRSHVALRRGGLRWAHVDADTIEGPL